MTGTCSPPVNREIIHFVGDNKIASICCVSDNKPHCFTCFYSVLPEDNCLVFKSSESSTHMQILSGNNEVAGTIISSEISMLKIQGIQFEGVVTNKDAIGIKATKSYYTRYPFAVTVPGRIWVLELHSIKYTNTTNGIKHKTEWNKG